MAGLGVKVVGWRIGSGDCGGGGGGDSRDGDSGGGDSRDGESSGCDSGEEDSGANDSGGGDRGDGVNCDGDKVGSGGGPARIVAEFSCSVQGSKKMVDDPLMLGE